MQETIAWVSVKDRLPPHHVTILARTMGGFVFRGFRSVYGEYFHCPIVGRIYSVTHWAEMPKGPSE